MELLPVGCFARRRDSRFARSDTPASSGCRPAYVNPDTGYRYSTPDHVETLRASGTPQLEELAAA